jgi:formate dehydrogenase major subunit
MSADDPLPRVPEAPNPQHETPLTEGFVPGTANDPPVRDPGVETVHVTVDGTDVAVRAGTTLLDAVDAAGEAVPALCSYDRDTEAGDEIGPRSECRTCVVEVDGDLVPACSHRVEDGLAVRTDTDRASEARDVNLDLVLSNHNLRCTTCDKNGRCELQDAAIENDVDEPRYGVLDDRNEYEPIDGSSSFIQIDRNKCILCARCVDACNDVQVEGVLRIEGQGQDTRIAFQNGAEAMADSTCVSCGHCTTVCPTGALTETGMSGVSSLPIPGFDQRTSVGSVLEHEAAETADTSSTPNRGIGAGDDGDDGRAADESRSGLARFMANARRKARETARNAGKTALREVEHLAEGVAANSVPEGVLFDSAKALGDYRLSKVDRTETTCGYCSVGCRFDVLTKDDEFLAVQPIAADRAPMNDFSTCVKGKFGYEFTDSESRLTTPLVREDGDLRPATWAEAYDRVVAGLSAVLDDAGPDAISCFASSKCTNEEDYLMQKFARQVLGTKNVDNCARLCHSSTVAALKQTVGYGAMSNSGDDVANADCYLITGSNTTESHPVLATRIKRNVRDGAELYVFDPRKVGIADHADRYVRTEPGYDVAWLNGLTRYVIEEGLYDREFVGANVRGFEALREKVDPFTPEAVQRLAGVDPADLAHVAERIAAADACVFGWAMGMTQHAHGTQNVLAVANLALVTGHVGKPNAGLSPFRGHNNVQGGGGDMGTLPNCLPGYQPLDDEAVGAKFEAVWGERPPSEVGLTVTEAFDAVHDGDVRGMYVMGENPALSEPDIDHAEAALSKLDFLVVQDIFPTETTAHADVVLPAASFVEKSGTFTNTERRVQLVGKAMDPPGDARQDWEILSDLAGRFGYDWDYGDPSEVMDEIADLTPIYGGISHDRLDEEGGLQWPCEDETDPGTRFLYEDGFAFPDGNARFVPADMGRPGELPDEAYPLTLTTGRVLYHFHTGTLTRRVEGIMSHVGESFVEIHPETADRLGVEDESYVRVASRRGEIVVRADVTDRVGPGVVFVPMHFAHGAANALTNERFDETSGIPEYKVASVRVTPLDGDADPTPLAPSPDADDGAGGD